MHLPPEYSAAHTCANHQRMQYIHVARIAPFEYRSENMGSEGTMMKSPQNSAKIVDVVSAKQAARARASPSLRSQKGRRVRAEKSVRKSEIDILRYLHFWRTERV
jgi:hypothetical protein